MLKIDFSIHLNDPSHLPGSIMITAHHEAGHVLLAEALGGRVVYVSVLPAEYGDVRAHGVTKAIWPHSSDSARDAMLLAKVALAGPAAELIYCDEQYSFSILREWWTDWQAATNALRVASPEPLTDEQLRYVLKRLFQEMIAYVSRDEVWDRIAGLADELDAHETLEEDQLEELRELGQLSIS